MAATNTLAKALGYMAKHPSLTLGTVGGASGFVASGFSGWGLVAGAGIGMAAGRGRDPFLGERGSRFAQLRGRVAKKILTSNPDLARSAWGGAAGRLDRSGTFIPFTERGMATRGAQVMSGVGLRAAGGLTMGAVGGIGAAIGMRAIGSNYGSERKTRYGAVFSGMGNGTYGGYR